MSAVTLETFSESFLDDYFAESAEHLTAVRRTLLALESGLAQSRPNAALLPLLPLLEELFRRFHSLKGISGMVGVEAAEELAHEMESYLRALRKEEAELTAAGVDGLITGTNALEQVIAARHTGQQQPEISAALAQLVALIPAAKTATPPMPAADADGRTLWRCTFQPRAELAARGVNVNQVRLHLQSLGELLRATPQVSAEGVAFEFLLASNAEAAAFADGAYDGLTCVREEAPPAKTPPSNGHPGEGTAASLSAAPSQMVRVNLARLDELMRMVGEMVISRSRLEDQLQRVETALPSNDWRALQESNLALERGLRDLREGVMRARMVPIAEVFERMPFVVRDLAREADKQVRLELHGQHTEIDKYLVERMMDPLLHLVRNAVCHGLEPAAERRALGKPPEGRLSLRAATAGETVLIEIEDDGRGMDAGQILARAQTAGLPRAAAGSDAEALLEAICAQGFSTREQADRASGRGVGMDVVKTTVQELGGALTLDTAPGRGARFTVELPLTLAIADALIVHAGGQSFAVPQAAVREVLAVDASTIKTLENNELIPYRGGVLPLLRLTQAFNLPAQPRASLHVFVIGSGLGAMGIAVDRIAGQREIVVRAINDPLIKVPGIAGITELGDGRAVLILDVAALKRGKTGWQPLPHATTGDAP